MNENDTDTIETGDGKTPGQIANAARKSLMLDKPEYDRISALAKKAGVPRPTVIAAMLETLDEPRMVTKLQQLRAAQKVEAAEESKKRRALAALASELDMSQIEALLKQVQKA